jgi:hypothetical protein
VNAAIAAPVGPAKETALPRFLSEAEYKRLLAAAIDEQRARDPPPVARGPHAVMATKAAQHATVTATPNDIVDRGGTRRL